MSFQADECEEADDRDEYAVVYSLTESHRRSLIMRLNTVWTFPLIMLCAACNKGKLSQPPRQPRPQQSSHTTSQLPSKTTSPLIGTWTTKVNPSVSLTYVFGSDGTGELRWKIADEQKPQESVSGKYLFHWQQAADALQLSPDTSEPAYKTPSLGTWKLSPDGRVLSLTFEKQTRQFTRDVP